MIRLIIEAGQIDRECIEAHTVRFDHLAETAREWPPDRRMNFRDKDGAPLIKRSDPWGAFEAGEECMRGRPRDRASGQNIRQADRIRTRIDHAAPQALVVPS